MHGLQQIPVPPGAKSSRASTRPTSAGTAVSDSPRGQRPWSARSAGSRGDAPRSSVTYEADFATASWSDLSAPSRSRPTSAKSHAPATVDSAGRRLSAVSGLELVPRESAASRQIEHHSLEEQILASPDFGRRSLEEELREPILTPIPNSIATPLEKQIATAVGLRGRARLVPRLPRTVVGCKHGADCSWRWLARVALEQIWGSSLASFSLAESVQKIKEEFAHLHTEHGELEAEQLRAKAAEAAAAQLQEELTECKIDSRDFRVLEREHGRLQSESVELQTVKGRLEAELELQTKKWHQQREAILEKATSEAEALRGRAERAEASALTAQAVEQELRQRIQELQEQVRELKSVVQEDRKKMALPSRKNGRKKSKAKRSSRNPSKTGSSPSKSRSKSRAGRRR